MRFDKKKRRVNGAFHHYLIYMSISEFYGCIYCYHQS